MSGLGFEKSKIAMCEDPKMISYIVQNPDVRRNITQNPGFIQNILQDPSVRLAISQNSDMRSTMIQNPSFIPNILRDPKFISAATKDPTIINQIMSNNKMPPPPPPPPTSAEQNSLCSVNGSGNYLGYAGMDTQSLTKPTRYYNKSDCEELKGTFQKIPDNYNGQSFNARAAPLEPGAFLKSYPWSNRFNVGTCVRPNVNGKTVDLSSTCATLPTNLALNMRVGNMIPAQGTIFGTPQCKEKGSLFTMDQNGGLRCTVGDSVRAMGTNNNIMLA